MKRLEFSRKTRAAAFLRCQGACEICGIRLHPGRFEYHHIKEANDEGEATLDNCQVICVACHKPLTAAYTRALRKAERVRDKFTGAKPRSRKPIPGSRDTPWKHTFKNGWVPRNA